MVTIETLERRSPPPAASALVTGVLPPGAVAFEQRLPGDASRLFASEAAACATFAPKRIAEFAAGRDCARTALAAVGAPPGPLGRLPDRRPSWPAGFTGSITHTSGFCCAAAASLDDFAALGIDAEVGGRITPDMWSYLFVPHEIERFATAPAADRDRAATLAFSAKEAFYKCQSTLTGLWIDFEEVAVTFAFDRAHAGSFQIVPISAAVRERFAACALQGRFAFDGELVVTGIAVRAGAAGW